VSLIAFLCCLLGSLFASAPARANTGSTGETTWVNGNTDPAATNQFSSDSAVGCPTTINIWQTNAPAFDGPTYFHVDSIDPTDDPFVHASGMYTTTVGSSMPVKIASIDTATLIQSAKDTGQPLDTNGQGYHYRLVFDFYLTSTVDFWVKCADTNPPAPDSGTTTTTTGSDTTTPGTPSTCPKLSNKDFTVGRSRVPQKGKVRILAWSSKRAHANRIVLKVINGKHVKTYGNSDTRSFTVMVSIHNTSVWGKASWRRAHLVAYFYLACGKRVTYTTRYH
jgi:hypothetical protein